MTRSAPRTLARTLAGALLVTAGLSCSELSGNTNTPIALEIISPIGTGPSALVEIGDTVQLSARALNQAGDSIGAEITWRTPDTLVISVDSTTGAITGRSPGTGRIQARSESLVSDFLTFTVVPGADTLQVIPPDSFRVLVTDSASSALVAELDTLNPDGPLGNRRIEYALVYPIFGQPGDTATLNGGTDTVLATTASTGQPATPVTVQVVPGQPRPDSVFVEITARRPSGALIPGSGQRFIVRFD